MAILTLHLMFSPAGVTKKEIQNQGLQMKKPLLFFPYIYVTYNMWDDTKKL